MADQLPDQAQVVIIGGGVAGTALAFRLSELGCRDVVVLERGQLGCGTSWHAAGNIPLMDHDTELVRLNRIATDLYESFNADEPIGWRRCGRVMFARTEARLQDYRVLIATAQSVGEEAYLLSPAEVAEKLPLFRTDDIVGGLWSPNDGRVNPTDLIGAYARRARSAGARLLEGVSVSEVEQANGGVCAVATSQGRIRCETVVNCAGLWSRALGLRHRLAIPIYAVEHFYALTEVVPDVGADMPTFRDPDGLIYGREEVGGLLVGCFDRDAKPISSAELADDFFFSLLNEDWDQFGPYMQQAIHRIPALADAGIRTLLNGPEGFTPDSRPILSDVPQLRGYFVFAGLSSGGILRSAGMGQAMAEWIVNGGPGIDVAPYSLARFTAQQNDENWLRQHIRDSPSGYLATER